MNRSGFYPRGGGEVQAVIATTSSVRPLNWTERGPIERIRVISAVAGLPAAIAKRQARRAAFRLEKTGLTIDVEQQEWAGGPGTMLALIVDTSPVPLLFFALGERGKLAERVADEAADQVLSYLGREPAALDPHSADQVVLPLAFADRPSRFTVSEVTRHLLTNIDVIRRFVDRDIACAGAEGQPGTLTIG
jgi:RNA 3'-terminal phosphate cyclase (ATP)